MHSITRATEEGAEKLSKFRQCYYRMVAGSNLAHCFKAFITFQDLHSL